LTVPPPTAIWIGQDGHDLVGPASTPGPDDVQDIHIALAGLPANLAITTAEVAGAGGGTWDYNLPQSHNWAAALVQSPGSTTADLYIEPYQVETGRMFSITLTYSDQSTDSLSVMGGTADPNLRMPGKALAAQWVGQVGQDWTGPGPAVGPDGFQDVDLSLANLSTTTAIVSASLTASGGGRWAFGTNPGLFADAELIANPTDPSKADLYFSPIGNLQSQTLTVTVAYANGKTDTAQVIAGTTNPALRMPAPAPVAVSLNAFAVSWVGQDGQNLTGPGDVHLKLSGLPGGRTVTAAQLSDGTLNTWGFARPGATFNDGNVVALPLAFQGSTTDPTRADVDFPPIRNESQATLTLRLVLDDGTNLVATFPGGAADPGLRSPNIAASHVVAQPGDDLQSLANQYGTVHLSAGTYNLSAPLVLNRPVTITADPGATLLFAQPAGDSPWTAAIKINAGHTTLNGFAVRFAGPINWNASVSYSPAVIGTTDNLDPGPVQLLEDITLTGLDLMAPPAASAWEPAPSLIRVVTAQNGVIQDNLLKGGTTEFIGGPWQVVGNTYEGTVPGTYTTTAFAGHFTHDVLIANNVVQPVGPSGKTYRFLVLTQSGIGDVVQGNTVVGIGPMDSDTEPNPNATEVLLTEAYYVEYEGVPMTISPNGRIVQISSVLFGSLVAGDVLSILAGPQAGQWREIAQVLNPTTILLSSPIDPGSTTIEISTGFINESFVGNTIDTRGSSTANDLVLAGNQFGVQVLNNTLVGGSRAFWITAYASQTPSTWGWTHVPILGAVISGNTIEDTLQGGLLDVEHSGAIKSNVGRTYMSATLTNNTGVWTSAFLDQPGVAGATAQPAALTIGMATSNDPGELVVSASGNQVEGPVRVVAGTTLETIAATVNGQVVTNQGTVLPTVSLSAPTGLALVDDTGISATDGITSDADLHFNPVDQATGYEYSLTGAAGTYQPVALPFSFLPQGLAPGFNTIFVRASDVSGNRGPDALILIDYDPTTGTTASSSSPSPSARPVRYEYRIANTGTYVPLGTSMSLTLAQEASGPVLVQIEMVNPVGVVGVADTGTPRAPGEGVSSGSTSGTAPASGTGATPSATPTPVSTSTPTPTPAPTAGGAVEGSRSASNGPEATSSSTTDQVPLPTSATLTASRQGLIWPVKAETLRLTKGPGRLRHPNPFGKGRTRVQALGLGHSSTTRTEPKPEAETARERTR
jgi:hypothetical protein